MLFYNHKQEFIGLDEDALKLLNYASLEELLSVCPDVADLFAKEPGYIHNFKNFGWIDFLLHADSESNSAIVHGNGRTFSCTLHVQKLFLCEAPSETGYMVEMLHVQSMSGEEIKPHTITPRPVAAPSGPAPIIETPIVAEEKTFHTEPAPSILPDYGHITPTPLSEPGVLDVPSYEESEYEPFSEPYSDTYEKLTLPEFESYGGEAVAEPVETPIEQPAPRPVRDTRFTAAEQKYIDMLKVDRSYRFDPNVAASELGLPVDLIQEFIGDFIQQSHDFKNDLFDAALRADMNNLKILSHKLKGVAANLRIEDAFECLSVINTSDDIAEIEANLKYFYAIVDKLEGKSSPQGDEALQPAPEPLPEAEESPEFSYDEDIGDLSYTGTSDTSYDDYGTLGENSYGGPLSEPVSSFTDEEEIYAFDIKESDFEEPSAPAKPQMPEYGFGLKHDEDSPLIIQEEELFEPDLDAGIPEDEVFAEPAEPNLPAEPAPIRTLHYDKSAVAGQLGIERAFLDELIDDYKRDALVSGERIASAIAAFDTHLWQSAARELKGISDNLRLSEISEELAVLSVTNDAQEANKASKRLNGYLEQL